MENRLHTFSFFFRLYAELMPFPTAELAVFSFGSATAESRLDWGEGGLPMREDEAMGIT